jgi:hypothetical protein
VAVFAVPGPSVPGLAIPGDASPGYPGAATAACTYTGLVPVVYLQYLGPGGTLDAAPGEVLPAAAVAVASGCPFTLAVPPADGRWVTSGGQPVYEAVLRPAEVPEDPRVTLHRARVHIAALHASWARKAAEAG